MNLDDKTNMPVNREELKKATKIDIRDWKRHTVKTRPENIYRLEIPDKLPAAEILAKFPNVMEIEAKYFKHIPKDFFKFLRLKILSFYDSKIDEIPAEIGFLQELEVLKFDVCEFFLEKKLRPRTFWEQLMGTNVYPIYEPESSLLNICSLSFLKELSFKDRPIYEFPEEIIKLENLESLTFHRTELISLPQNLQFLYQLKKIAINGNYEANYTQILEVLSKCRFLEEIFLEEIRKDTITLDIAFLKNLEKLRVFSSQNTFVKNIEVLNDLPHLEKIDLSRPDIHYYKKGIVVPKEFTTLRNLKELNLNGNKNPQLLSKIEQNIAQWHGLEKLDLGNCELQSIPEEIGELSQLNYLNLAENELTELPHTFDYLTNLKTLNVKNTKIHPKYINRFREIMPKVRIITD